MQKEMRNLVYIASGQYNSKYESLPFDKVYLVDRHIRKVNSDKVVCLKMDALECIDYFRDNSISIDCLVILRESQGEGGYTFNLCSDLYMGYFMTALPKEFIWVCNGIDYYFGLNQSRPDRPVYSNCRQHNLRTLNYVSFNLPYAMEELHCNDAGYINPFEFTSLEPNRSCHVYRMTYCPHVEEIPVTSNVSVRLIQDSVWAHYDELDRLYISFQPSFEPMRDFFTRRAKVKYYKQMQFQEMLQEAAISGYSHIGFTPHYWHQYDRNYKKMLEEFLKKFSGKMIIDFYYMNSWFNCDQIRKAIKTIQRIPVEQKQ